MGQPSEQYIGQAKLSGSSYVAQILQLIPDITCKTPCLRTPQLPAKGLIHQYVGAALFATPSNVSDLESNVICHARRA